MYYRAYILIALTLMACASEAEMNDRWLSATVTHEGAPLALRVRPDVDTPVNRARWTTMVAITLELAQVRDDGLPVPSYNDGLAALDSALVTLLEGDSEGSVVIIETGGGQRTYYSYATVDAAAKRSLAALQKSQPGHQLQIRSIPDSAWSLFDEYRRLFRF